MKSPAQTLMLPPPSAIPKPLPPRLLPEIIDDSQDRRLLLCLDFDGTLSEIRACPKDARPVRNARRAIRALAKHPGRIAVAIISGRDLPTLCALLRPEGRIWMVGGHGIETIDPRGKRHVVPAAKAARSDLARVRAWMKDNVPRRAGFVIEDKGVAIAFHYRIAPPRLAIVVRKALSKFLGRGCPSVAILHGKMVDEVIPRKVGGKGAAVRRIQNSLGKPAPFPVYFGDDATDEDAFHELRDDGITVRIGGTQRSWAQYRLDSPATVVVALQALIAALEPRRKMK
ncbi:MAG: trehalose-phosphatase [Candidatus Binataceae bacterium]